MDYTSFALIGLGFACFLLAIWIHRSTAPGFRGRLLRLMDEQTERFWEDARKHKASIGEMETIFDLVADINEKQKRLQGQFNQFKGRISEGKGEKKDEVEMWAEVMQVEEPTDAG